MSARACNRSCRAPRARCACWREGTDTLKGGHRTGAGISGSNSRCCQPLLGVHPLGCVCSLEGKGTMVLSDCRTLFEPQALVQRDAISKADTLKGPLGCVCSLEGKGTMVLSNCRTLFEPRALVQRDAISKAAVWCPPFRVSGDVFQPVAHLVEAKARHPEGWTPNRGTSSPRRGPSRSV
jgi:hypothetical protein